jgi:hypothetical protein
MTTITEFGKPSIMKIKKLDFKLEKRLCGVAQC